MLTLLFNEDRRRRTYPGLLALSESVPSGNVGSEVQQPQSEQGSGSVRNPSLVSGGDYHWPPRYFPRKPVQPEHQPKPYYQPVQPRVAGQGATAQPLQLESGHAVELLAAHNGAAQQAGSFAEGRARERVAATAAAAEQVPAASAGQAREILLGASASEQPAQQEGAHGAMQDVELEMVAAILMVA